MRSNNPVFSNGAFAGGAAQRSPYASPYPSPQHGGGTADDLQALYDAPAAGPLQTRRMTLDDVVMKTAAMFAVLLVTAGAAWVLTPTVPVLPFVGMIGGLVLGLVIVVKRSTNPALHLTYAALEGLLVGGISQVFQTYVAASGSDSNVVAQAVIGTLSAFTAMLVLNRIGVLKATPRFTKMLLIAMGGYLVLALASFVSSFFGVGDGFGFYGTGLGLLLSVAGVALASFSLVLDFDSIEAGIRAGVPEKQAWLAAFGLVVTLVWLYLELLRLLAILQGRE